MIVAGGEDRISVVLTAANADAPDEAEHST